MNIEKSIFKKSVINKEKLVPYGFVQDGGRYLFTRNIMDDSFRVEVTVEGESFVGRIIDLEFGGEYTNHRVDAVSGEFVNTVRSEYENVLMDIRSECCIQQYFLSPQANRIALFMTETYGDIPEFPWDKSPDFGIFRNPCNKKWYGLIMNISRGKLDSGDDEVNVINVKADSQKLPHLLSRSGIYKAYHMNKDNWITIILDDTLTDDEVIELIRQSHGFTELAVEWLVPVNPKYYDIIHAFDDNDIILLKQSSGISVGCMVYLYICEPYSAIMYKCEVTQADIPYEYKDKNVTMKRAMRVRLVKKYSPDKFTFSVLGGFGIKAVRGPRRIPEKLSVALNEESSDD